MDLCQEKGPTLSVSACRSKVSIALCRYIQYDVSSPVVPEVSF